MCCGRDAMAIGVHCLAVLSAIPTVIQDPGTSQHWPRAARPLDSAQASGTEFGSPWISSCIGCSAISQRYEIVNRCICEFDKVRSRETLASMNTRVDVAALYCILFLKRVAVPFQINLSA